MSEGIETSGNPVNTMFIGEYSHTIDEKGRMIVPVKFREGLGEKFYLTNSLDHCLVLYARDTFMEFLQRLPNTSEKAAKKIRRFYMAGAVECELDKQGRIMVPPSLRAYACLTKDVVSAGTGETIEVWDAALWAEANDPDDIDAAVELMRKEGYKF